MDDDDINGDEQQECIDDEEVKNNDRDCMVSNNPVSILNLSNNSEKQWDLSRVNALARSGKTQNLEIQRDSNNKTIRHICHF